MKTTLVLFFAAMLWGSSVLGQTHNSTQSNPAVQFILPLEGTFDKDFFITQYMAHIYNGGFHDYMGGNLSYDSSRIGTDFIIPLYRYGMEKTPRFVIAAADGIVTDVKYDMNDRHIYEPRIGNYVKIRHSDGTTTEYRYIRQNSVLVTIGEHVKAGQEIAQLGCSGPDIQPYLYFIIRDSSGKPRDPFHGAQNNLPSLWKSEPPYVPTLGMQLIGIMPYTKDNEGTGGDINQINFDTMWDGLVRIQTIGREDENLTGFGFQLFYQATASNHYTMHVVNETSGNVNWNNTHTAIGTVPLYQRDGQQFSVDWMNPSEDGPWEFQFFNESTEQAKIDFEIAPNATIYYPDFDHHGLVFRANGTPVKDILHLRFPGGKGPMGLLTTIPGVSFKDSVVSYDGNGSGSTRMTTFSVSVTNQSGLMDTATYYVIDTTKPMDLSPIPPPALLYPQNKQLALAKNISLRWQDVLGTEWYQVQAASDVNFTQIIADRNYSNDTTFSLSGLIPGNTYYWRVRITNGVNPSDWSVPNSFTINTPPKIQAPDITTKKDSAAVVAVIITDQIPENVKLTAHSQDQSILSDSAISITGSGASRSLKVIPRAVGSTDITLKANDGIDTASLDIKLTVKDNIVKFVKEDEDGISIITSDKRNTILITSKQPVAPAFIAIYDITGQEMFRSKAPLGTRPLEIPIGGCGIYLVRIITNEETITTKVIAGCVQ